MEVPEISETIHLAEEAVYSKVELEAYESYWNQVRSDKSLMEDRYSKGKAEAEKTRQIAKKMLQKGMAFDVISNLTGLSERKFRGCLLKSSQTPFTNSKIFSTHGKMPI